MNQPLISTGTLTRQSLAGQVAIVTGGGQGIFVSVTSEGLAYMGMYESMKAAQAHLARILDAELEETGVSAFWRKRIYQL